MINGTTKAQLRVPLDVMTALNVLGMAHLELLGLSHFLRLKGYPEDAGAVAGIAEACLTAQHAVLAEAEKRARPEAKAVP